MSAVKDKQSKNITAEQLVLTKAKRKPLERYFVEKVSDKSERAKVLIPYTKWDVPQIISAMYVSAAKTNDQIVVTPAGRTTMDRSHAVARAWVNSKAAELVDEDDMDHVLQVLSQIADIPPGELVKYALPERKREDARIPEWGTVTVKPRPTAEIPEPKSYDVELTYGSGPKALFRIIERYMEERIETTPELAMEWLDHYRNGVAYVSGLHRAAGRKHNQIAADARKGDTKGTSRGARPEGNKKRKGKGKDTEPDEKAPASSKRKKAKPAPPKTGDARAVQDLSTAELIRSLTKRVADYTVALTVKDAGLKDEFDAHWEKRFKQVPLDKTILDVKGKGKKARVKGAKFAPITPLHPVDSKGNLNVAEMSVEAQMARGEDLKPTTMNTILIHMERRGQVTAEKRKEIMSGVHAGHINQVQFRSRVAKLTAKFDMRQTVNA